MKEGLLWYDDSGDGLEEKVRRVARHYERKFGARPELCFVHRSAMGGNGKVLTVDEVEVRAGPCVLLHHFWIGRGEIPRSVRNDG